MVVEVIKFFIDKLVEEKHNFITLISFDPNRMAVRYNGDPKILATMFLQCFDEDPKMFELIDFCVAKHKQDLLEQKVGIERLKEKGGES